MNLRVRAGFLTAALVMCSAAASPASGQTAAGPSSLDSLIAAELAFAKAARERNVRDAFLSYIADDGVLFRPGPVNGRTALEGQAANRDRLDWRPIYADIAASGDLGFTTGPWTFRPEAGGAPAFGHFVTVWKRQPDGSWRFVADIGIRTTAADTTYPAEVERRTPPRPPTSAVSPEELILVDSMLTRLAEQRGYANALLAVLAPGGRVLRNGSPPAIGSAAARPLLTGDRVTWSPAAAGTSSAADLGYTWGAYELRTGSDDEPERGNYLHIWRRGADGDWRLVLDLATPLPRAAGGPQPE